MDFVVKKIHGMKLNYTTKLFQEKARFGKFFDEILEFILSEDTMTWSNLYLVQGIKGQVP